MAEEETGRRLDDRIKVIAASVLLGAVPIGVFLFSMITAVKDDLALYKLTVAREYVCVGTYTADTAEIKSLLREVRDEIRDHERQSLAERPRP